MITNAEKIIQHLKQHGPESVRIHSMTGTPFWLVCQKTERTWPDWRILLCDPTKTTWRLVSERVTDSEYEKAWLDLLDTKIGLRLKFATEELRKKAKSITSQQYEHHNTSIRKPCNSSKSSSARHTTQQMGPQSA